MLGFGAAEGQALALSSLSFKPAFFVREAATHPPPAQWCTLASTATVSVLLHLSNQHCLLVSRPHVSKLEAFSAS